MCAPENKRELYKWLAREIGFLPPGFDDDFDQMDKRGQRKVLERIRLLIRRYRKYSKPVALD
jgi:hypothetical protein